MEFAVTHDDSEYYTITTRNALCENGLQKPGRLSWPDTHTFRPFERDLSDVS